MLSYHSGLRKTLRWYKKAWEHNLEMLFTNAFYYYLCSTLTEISLTCQLQRKYHEMSNWPKKRKLSWKQLQAFTTLHQSQKERKLKIQHGCKQGKSNVTFVDIVKTAQSFVFIHASVFVIKTLGCQSIKSKSPLK